MGTSGFETAADFIARGLDIAPLDTPPSEVPPGTRCAISGAPIERGYPVSFLVTGATSEFLDAFREGLDGHVSESAARCWKLSNPRLGNPTARAFLVFEDVCYMPMISRESARKQGRPCWSELAREIWPARAGQRVLCLLTTDQKKRLWPRARIGALGDATPVFIYDAGLGIGETRVVSWSRLLDCLDAVERAYSCGFAKEAIAESLYRNSNVLDRVGMAETRRMEMVLACWRRASEFVMALLIAQKAEQSKEGSCTQMGLL